MPSATLPGTCVSATPHTADLATDTDTPAASSLCVVIDSNVWIDILVFDDPLTRPIRDALTDGTIHAVINAACFYEIELVLDYPQFARFEVDKSAALATLRRRTRWIETAERATTTSAPRSDASSDIDESSETRDTASAAVLPLPRCRDRDDQKFLELAADARAAWLVTKDKALLKLSRRMTRDFACRVERPAVFADTVCGPTASLVSSIS